jgi:hypothetical protein
MRLTPATRSALRLIAENKEAPRKSAFRLLAGGLVRYKGTDETDAVKAMTLWLTVKLKRESEFELTVTGRAALGEDARVSA